MSAILDRLRINFGLDSDIISVGADYLVSSCLSSYMRAFPSRTVGIRVCQGYSIRKLSSRLTSFFISREAQRFTAGNYPELGFTFKHPSVIRRTLNGLIPPFQFINTKVTIAVLPKKARIYTWYRQNSRCHFIHMTGKENIACQEVIAGRQFFSNR